MKIAMMVRGYITAPQPTDIIYAPINLAISIAGGLVKRGHSVDFYGPEGSKLASGVKTHDLRPLVANQEDFQELISTPNLMTHYILNLWDGALAYQMFEAAKNKKYDLLYFIHPEVQLLLSKVYGNIPIVSTIHDPIDKWYRELYKMFAGPNQHVISISKNQRSEGPDLPHLTTVYNGIDISLFPFSETSEDYLLYIGRIVPEKGLKEAIEVAQKSDQKLLIIGPIYKDTQIYFDQFIRPKLNGKIKYLGYIEQNELWKYYQKAKAFLAPLQWEEPFGLTLVEAMACGTPVIGLRRGSIPEIVIDGKTGYIVDTVEQMARAVSKIDKIDRKDCRKRAEYFSIDRMVDGYEKAFKRVLGLS
jgi:glycosyltransferase involved in cell wall biosynthesis